MLYLENIHSWQKQVKAALKNYDFYGEAPNAKRQVKTMYGMDKSWVRIAKRSEEKLRRILSRTKFDFNITFVLTNKAYLAKKKALYFEDRYLRPQEIEYLRKQGILKEEHDAQAINIIFTGSGTNKKSMQQSMTLPPTPWIIVQ